jgi:hypothetical protein
MNDPQDPTKADEEGNILPELGLTRPAAHEGVDQSVDKSDQPRAGNASAADARDDKATRFDGNPSPVGTDSGILGPKDDTPAFLEKKEGVRSDQ